jgi:hypothetical protein
MRPRVVYIAGPFRGASYWQQEQNVRRAEELALEVWRMGAAAVCPHTITRFYQGELPDAVWLDGDIAVMLRCQAVLMLPDWPRSSGATEERRVALEAGIPVFETLDDLRAWLDEPLAA